VTDAVLVVNAGSSSVKFSVYDADAHVVLLRGQVQAIGEASVRFDARDAQGAPLAVPPCPPGADHAAAIDHVLGVIAMQPSNVALVAAGHRVVHGGPDHAAPVVVDERVLAELSAYVPLAPLHQPHNVAAIEAVARRAPALPQVACFDTAFHRSQPACAQLFALPPEITARGVRRYGFHGLSYEYVAGALRELDPDAARGRTIVAHLGNGASMCAMQDGRSVATTMGFTPLDGLVMGTRAGALDPGVVLHLQRALGHSLADVERLLYHRAGLLGVSGVSADMRTLLASDDPRAAQAVEMFCYRAVREIGSLAAALGGLDALVFTGGIGEHAAPVRERIVQPLGWLGVATDAQANASHGPRIGAAGSRVAVWVVPTDEEKVILRHTLALLGRSAGAPRAGVPSAAGRQGPPE
jgi:acetate kinase